MATSTHSRVSHAERLALTPEDEFLLFIGTRVRELRNLRGMVNGESFPARLFTISP